ncbi:MAG: hypothetical protein IPJ13_08580 [Saprospiraceae bacterium]|nr:hypothetical protein [Saprospiraceae bacterium]
MKYVVKTAFLLGLTMLSLYSCSNKPQEIDELLAADIRSGIERGKNIRIIYSDSAVVKVIIHAPVMERYNEPGNSKDVFPKGILLEFLEKIRWSKAG